MLNGDGFSFSKIILAIGTVDLRKGIDGLCSVIRYWHDRVGLVRVPKYQELRKL